jgi:prolyl oligopeptidase
VLAWQAVFLLLPAALASAAPPEPPPAATIRVVHDQYGGITLTDEFRWMETPSAELHAWLQAETAYTDALINRIPDREKLQRDIAALDGDRVQITDVTPSGPLLFYLKQGPQDDIPRLMMREVKGGAERVLVDPEALADAIPKAQIMQFQPSIGGGYVAYTLAPGGPDSAVLRVYDVARHEDLAERMGDARFADVAWKPDDSGFYYTAGTAEAANQPAHLKVYFHRLRTAAQSDRPVLDGDALPFPLKQKTVIPRIVVPPASDYALAIVSNGATPEMTIYVAPISQLAMNPAPWQKVADAADHVTQVVVNGPIAYLLCNDGVAGTKVMSEDLAAPGFSDARTVSRDGGVITGMAAARDALYVARRLKGHMILQRLDYDSATPIPVAVPFQGTIAPAIGGNGGLVADARVPGAIFSLESWVHPRQWLHYDTDMPQAADLGLAKALQLDESRYEVVETTARARDGVEIPLSIISRHGVALDNERPALITAYGSFGYPFDPKFLAWALAWVDRGGVFAVAHVRGGGEGGPVWHAVGSLKAKHYTISDLLDCAEALKTRNYTNSDHLAAMGEDAGAIAVAGAMVADPTAFRAVAIRNGLNDPLHEGEMPGGEQVAVEFGRSSDTSRFPALLGMDPYFNITDGAQYPAVLLTGSEENSLAPVWESAKMAARLMEATRSGNPILLRVAPNDDTSRASREARESAQAEVLSFLLWQLGVEGFQPSGSGSGSGPGSGGHEHSLARRGG